MPLSTTINEMNRAFQSNDCRTDVEYMYRVYNNKLIGNIIVARIVDSAVIVTLNAKSALNILHHQLEYDPPGLLVITNNVIPTSMGKRNKSTMENPIKGRMMNCIVAPINNAL